MNELRRHHNSLHVSFASLCFSHKDRHKSLLHQTSLQVGWKCEAAVPAIIVFGDSSVDSGNNNFIPTIAKCNFKPYGRDFPGGFPTGRFSNGRLSPDFISQGFGLNPIVPAYLDPSYNISHFASGVCFASAATGFDNVTSDVLGVIPMWKQVEYYKEYQSKLRAYAGDIKGNQIVSEGLYIVSVGTNDFLENYFAMSNRRSQFTTEAYQDFLILLARNFLNQLYLLGARKISLTGLPPMGCLPMERATNFNNPFHCVQEYNLVALEFNAKLSGMVYRMNKELPGITIHFSNPYDILLQLIIKPSFYGFQVAEVGCCGSGTFEMGFLCNPRHPFTCTDANKYVFWDAIHPTEKTNKIISDSLLQQLKPLFG